MSIPAGLLLTSLLLLLPAPPPAVRDGIEGQLGRPELKGARVAVCVIDVESGERVFARNIDQPLAPASNMKLITTAATVALLGPDCQLATRFVSAERPDNEGVLHGDLIVVGGGDPCLRSDLMSHEQVLDPGALLADLVAGAGVRRVEGRLLLDDALLDHEWVHPDWPAGDVQLDYAAPIGALSLNKNCLTLAIEGSGPSVSLLTVTQGYTLRNELRLADKPGTSAAGALRPDEAGVVKVRGEIGRAVPRLEILVPVRDPTELFGRCLLAALASHDVTVTGGMETAPGAGAGLDDRHLLTALQTPIENAVIVANKESDNSIADHLGKLLGALKGGQGTFASGGQVVTKFLADRVGTPTEGVVLRDGSGLSPQNRVTARLIADTLVYMTRLPAPARDLYLRTLPVAGVDGSLEERMSDPPYRGAVRAKTGYIHGVSCLSGYARTAGGRTLAFSILINDFGPAVTNKQMKAIEDNICRALVDLR